MKQLFILASLLLASLAALHASRNLPEVPVFGKLRASFFQVLENHVTKISIDWN